MEELFRLIQDGATDFAMIAPRKECEDAAIAQGGAWNVVTDTGLIVSQYRDGVKIWPVTG